MTMEVTVRSATSSDAPYLAQVMYDSMLPGVGHGIFDAALEGTGVLPVDFNEALILSGANNWGQLESFMVLETPDKIRAGAAGAFLSSVSDPRPLTAEGFITVSKHLDWTPVIARDFWRKYVSFYGFFGNTPTLAQPGDYVIEYVGVGEAFRGKGLYGRLLQAHADRAKLQNHQTLGVAAVVGNEPAIRSVLKFGFREVVRFGPEDYGGKFPGMVRFLCDVPEAETEMAPLARSSLRRAS